MQPDLDREICRDAKRAAQSRIVNGVALAMNCPTVPESTKWLMQAELSAMAQTGLRLRHLDDQAMGVLADDRLPRRAKVASLESFKALAAEEQAKIEKGFETMRGLLAEAGISVGEEPEGATNH